MRTYKKMNERGFTLVELMIVVAIIGVLAALAIYGVRRYLASAKTAEAKNTVGAITRGAIAAFENENAASEFVPEGTESTTASHDLCESAVAVPVAVPVGTKYQPSTVDGTDFLAGDTTTAWKCLKFQMTEPIRYQYHYTKDGMTAAPTNPAACATNCFEAGAVGNLDGDAALSRFSRTGEITANGQLRTSTTLFELDPFE